MTFEHFTSATGIHTRTIINGKPASVLVPIPDGIEDGDKWAREMGMKSLQRCRETGWLQVTTNQYMCVYCDKLVTVEGTDVTAFKQPCPCRTTSVPDILTA